MTSPWWNNWNLNFFPDTDPYGPLFGGQSVQEALYNTFLTWMPAYIREMNRQLGGNILTVPQRNPNRPEWTPSLGATPTPRLLVLVEGTKEEPEREQDNIRSCWGAEASIFLYGTTDWEETQALAWAYAACVAAIGVQQGGLGGFAEATKWKGSSYLEGQHAAMRTAGLAVVNFDVYVANTMNPKGGPPTAIAAPADISTDPSLLPTPPQPDVATTNVTLENTEV